MIGFEATALFLVVTLVAGATIMATLRRALPQARQLRQALASCPDKLELRCTIRETVVGWNDGTVVALPVRPRPVRLVQQAGLRAAA
jgi:hypothetical protein